MPDFSLAQVPDFSRAALSGYAAGQKIGRQRQLDAALGGFDFTRPESALPVLRLDPETGAALLGASQKMAQATRESEGREALSGYLLSRLGKAKGGDPASGVTQGTPGAPAAASDDIVITAAKQGPDYERQLIERDPQGYLAIQGNLDKLDSNARARVNDAAEAQGTIAMAAMRLPYDQRGAFIESQMPYLEAHGVTRQQVAQFDPTDENIATLRDQALGVQGILKQQNTERDDARQDRNVDSQIASRGLHDGLAIRSDQRAAAARGEAHVRFTERNNAKPGSAAAAPPVPGQTVTLNGKQYVKRNGKWFAQ